MSGEIAETSFTDLFTLPKLGRVYQCLDPTMPQRWSGPGPSTGWKLTPVPITNTHQPMQNSLPAGQPSPIDRPGGGHGGLAPWPVQTCKVGMQTEGVFVYCFCAEEAFSRSVDGCLGSWQ